MFISHVPFYTQGKELSENGSSSSSSFSFPTSSLSSFYFNGSGGRIQEEKKDFLENYSSLDSPHLADDYSLSLFRAQKHKHRRRRSKKKKCKKKKKCRRKRRKKRKGKKKKRKKGKKRRRIIPIADERFLVEKKRKRVIKPIEDKRFLVEKPAIDNHRKPIIDKRMNHRYFQQQTLIKTPRNSIKRVEKGKMRAKGKRRERENGWNIEDERASAFNSTPNQKKDSES